MGVTLVSLLSLGITSCGGESPCVQEAKRWLEMRKKIASDEFNEKQWEISEISNDKLRLAQRQASMDARAIKVAMAEEQFEKEKVRCQDEEKNGS